MYHTAHNNWRSLICLCANRSTNCYLPIIWHHSAVFVGGVCSHHGPMRCKREHLTCHSKVPVIVKAVKHAMNLTWVTSWTCHEGVSVFSSKYGVFPSKYGYSIIMGQSICHSHDYMTVLPWESGTKMRCDVLKHSCWLQCDNSCC